MQSLPIGNYSDLLETLAIAFMRRYPNGTSGRYRMIGILFARPESPLSKSSILNHLEYFHHRSGNNFDFFCAGYVIIPKLMMQNSQKEVSAFVSNEEWAFDPEAFNDIRSALEESTTWKYSGAADLILTNAKFDNETESVEIDYSSAIVCNLDQMLETKAIPSIEQFFEKICRHCDKSGGDDPTWGFSDSLAVNLSGSAFKRLILSLLPKNIGEEIDRLTQFAVVDIAKGT